jgi:hypothetical protein
MKLMKLFASWRRIWIYLSILTVLLMFSPALLPSHRARLLIMSYTKHLHELILYIVLCIVLLIPISYVMYIAIKSRKFPLKLFGFLMPFFALILGFFPYILFSYAEKWILSVLVILFFGILGSAFLMFMMKGAADEVVRRRVGFWAPKSWKYLWAIFFLLSNTVLFSQFLLAYFNPVFQEVILIFTRLPHILISYIIFCAIVLVPVSKILQSIINRTKFWAELLVFSLFFISFVPPFSFLSALTHGEVREAFTGYLIGALISAIMAVPLYHVFLIRRENQP